MDGVVLVKKESGITSHDLVLQARRALNEQRIGHTGTLDPLASGLMIIAVLLVMLGLIIDHQANKEKREHELYVLNWMRNEK